MLVEKHENDLKTKLRSEFEISTQCSTQCNIRVAAWSLEESRILKIKAQ